MRVEDQAAVVALWNRSLGDTFPLRQRLLHQTTLGDPELEEGDALVARRGGRLAGFALARRRRPEPGIETEAGWLEAVIVDPACQRQGLGTALVMEAEKRLLSRGAAYVWAGGGPAMLFPGVSTLLEAAQRFFDRRGYAEHDLVYDLLGDLEAIRRPEQVNAALAAARAEVRPCRELEYGAALAFLERHFPGDWPQDRRRHRAMGAPAHDIYLLWVAGQVVGLAQTYRDDAPVLGPNVYWAPALGAAEGGLGPIGVATAWRGRGLGLALLTLALEGLRARGVRCAVIDWTGILGFYARLGFRPWRSYLRRRKEIPSSG